MTATKKKFGSFGSDTGLVENEFVSINRNTKRFKRQFIKVMLPWIATIITSFPYNNRALRFIDQLILMSEAK
jgi:hypothetical protein